MNAVMGIALSALLLACVAQDTQDKPATQDAEQAVRDFVAVRDLEELDKLRSSSNDSWQVIADEFIIYETRKAAYLVEFTRACYELEDRTRIVADIRRERNIIRSRFDTIRGCRIRKIFALTEAEAAELKQLGESPGSRN
ncbi:MAG: hypothetical protein IIA11_00190 [Proteobacteria bacterium]|nr:hypothetical protein [Pseudomonadota bacterium]